MSSHLSKTSDLDAADDKSKPALARRVHDRYEEGSDTAAALFAGLFIGAVSTAMLIGLVALWL